MLNLIYKNGEGISTVLVEHCFVNGGDEKYLDSEDDIKKLARADCDALVQYYGLRLKSEYVASVNLNKNSIQIVKGGKEKLTATVLPNTAVNKKVKWTSSNENVAKVDQNGEITATGVGSATITVKTEEGGFTAVCNVNVIGIELQEKEIYMLKGEKYKLEYTPKDLDVEFDIENKDIIQIDNNKNITALKSGKSKVIIKSKKDKSLSAEMIVNVSELKDTQKIQINNLKESNLKLTKINEKTSLENFKKNINISSDLEIKIDNGNKDYITTNTMVSIIDKSSKKVIKKYKCFIYGDINEDGKITAADYVLIKNHIMETNILKSNYMDVADVSRDSKVTTKDYILIKNHIMNGSSLPIE